MIPRLWPGFTDHLLTLKRIALRYHQPRSGVKHAGGRPRGLLPAQLLLGVPDQLLIVGSGIHDRLEMPGGLLGL